MSKGLSREYAVLLSKAMPTQAVADLLNVLVSLEADGKFTDREVELGHCLFDQLYHECPEAVRVAQES